MTIWLDAFVPVLALLALGAFLRARFLREAAAWAAMEKLVFWVLLPALMAVAIGSLDLARVPFGPMAFAIWTALLAGTFLSYRLSRMLGADHPTTTSVLQGGIRFNNLIGFALAGALWGAPGLAFGGVATGLIVPCVQVILAFAFAADGRRLNALAIAKQALLNPLLLGCAAGFALAALGGPPPGLGALLRQLGQASIALGLLCVGAALTPAALAAAAGTQLATSALKLLVMPALTFALCRIVGLDPVATAMAVLFMALPTASTSYVMAKALGGNAPLMAAMTTTQHVLAILTLPLWVAFLKTLG